MFFNAKGSQTMIFCLFFGILLISRWWFLDQWRIAFPYSWRQVHQRTLSDSSIHPCAHHSITIWTNFWLLSLYESQFQILSTSELFSPIICRLSAFSLDQVLYGRSLEILLYLLDTFWEIFFSKFKEKKS